MMRVASVAIVLIALGPFWIACHENRGSEIGESPRPLSVILSVDPGSDERIAEALEVLRRDGPSPSQIERLGWVFVERARSSGDAGFYVLAKQAALALEQVSPGDPQAQLLRGHVLHSLHRFREAEGVARSLVARRGRSFDHGLLGDVLMEQGRLDEAVVHYEAMMQERPDAHAYSRAAHLRFLTGDSEGALLAMGAALRATSPHNADAWSWMATRLAVLQLQVGDVAAAHETIQAVLRVAPDSSAALLTSGRIALARSDTPHAVRQLRASVERNPQPEGLWSLRDALRVAGRMEEALEVEAELVEIGSRTDARGYALFLASAGERVEHALALAKREFEQRQDVYTHDALAWAYFSTGDLASARTHADGALSQGTRDARLLYHAGVILAAAGDAPAARGILDQADQLAAALLPSERVALETARAQLTADAG